MLYISKPNKTSDPVQTVVAELLSTTIFYLATKVQSSLLRLVPLIEQTAGVPLSKSHTSTFLVVEVQETSSSKSPKSTFAKSVASPYNLVVIVVPLKLDSPYKASKAVNKVVT